LNDSSVPAFHAHLPRPSLSRFIEGLWAVSATSGQKPHLIHDFRRLSGLTPSEYVATRLPDIDHAVIA